MLKRWNFQTSQLRPVVTVLWLPEEVSIMFWQKNRPGEYLPGLATRIKDSDCKPDHYVSELKRVSENVSSRKVQIIWLLPEEVFPSNFDGSGSEGRFVPILPQWIQDCWAGLPISVLPKHVVSGLVAVRNNLLNWETFKQPGTGYHLRLQCCSLFFMFTPEEVQTRISRFSLKPVEEGGLDPDWVRQTQSLYRSRSGYELRRILLSEPVAGATRALLPQESGVDFIHAGFPTNFLPVEYRGVDPAVGYIHSCGLLDSSRRVGGQTLELLERKRNREQWGRRFRGACALLLLGWVCSLLGACRNTPIQGEATSSDFLEWEGQRRMWKLKHSEWQSAHARHRKRIAPFIIAGAFARSLPDEIELERLNIGEVGKDASCILEMDGTCKGAAAASVFREWLNATRNDQPGFTVKNLKVSRSDSVMNFKLRAFVKGGES